MILISNRIFIFGLVERAIHDDCVIIDGLVWVFCWIADLHVFLILIFIFYHCYFQNVIFYAENTPGPYGQMIDDFYDDISKYHDQCFDYWIYLCRWSGVWSSSI